MSRDVEKNPSVPNSENYKCPVCGFYTLESFFGSYDICPVCFWEEDGVQFDNPLVWGGANSASLIQARINYHEFGATSKRLLQYVRDPEPAELSGKEYKSPTCWYNTEADLLLIETYNSRWNRMEMLDWREDRFDSKWTEVPWLTADGVPDPAKWKQLTFREAMKKRSTYELKRGMLERLTSTDYSFLTEQFGVDKDSVGRLSDDEARLFFNKLKETADSDNPFHETAEGIIDNITGWAIPCWDIPEWMTEW